MSKCKLISYDKELLEEYPEALEFVLLSVFKNFENGPFGCFKGNTFSLHKYLELDGIISVPKLDKLLSKLNDSNKITIQELYDADGVLVEKLYAFKLVQEEA